MFQTVPLFIIRSFSLYTQQWYMSYRFADSLRAESGWNCVPSVHPTPDDGQKNCLKLVEFHSKNKFEKSVHLAGFNIQKSLCNISFKEHLPKDGHKRWPKFNSCRDQQVNGVNLSSIRCESSRCHRNRRREYLRDKI